MLARVRSFSFRRPSVNVLSVDDEPVDMDDLIPIHSSTKSIRGLFNHKPCQEDRLDPNDFIYQESMDEGTNIGRQSMVHPQREQRKKTSFERLLELMLNRSADKGIQAPDMDDYSLLSRNVSHIHQSIEKQLHTATDLIQRKTLATMRILDLPIASEKMDKVLEQDHVGFTDALCFTINIAVKNIATSIAEGKVSLGKPDIEQMRKKFYDLTSSIESLRKTRVKVFSQFNKHIAIPLETMVASNDIHDDDRVTTGFYVPTVPRQKYMQEVFDDSSFESIFWSNYSSIMKQLVTDSLQKSAESAREQGQIQIQWEAWKRDNILCRVKPEEHFDLSSADIHVQLKIIHTLIDLACKNFKTAQACLKTATSDFRNGRKTLREFGYKVKISTLNTAEVGEILKIIEVAAATAVTFLKNIEKSTRMSRLFTSESIHRLRSVLGLMKDKKHKEFAYKPRYIALSFSIHCEAGIVVNELTDGAKSLVELFRDNRDITETKSEILQQHHSGSIHKFLSETAIFMENKRENRLQVSRSQEVIATEVQPKTPLNSQSVSHKKISSSTIDTNIGLLQLGIEKEIMNLDILTVNRLQQAYIALTQPSASAYEDDTKVPFMLGLCSILGEVIRQAAPYKEITNQNQSAITRTMNAFIESTHFGNEKKDFIRSLAEELTKMNELLCKLTKQQLVSSADPTDEIVATNQNMNADARSLAEVMRLQARGTLWQIRWIDRREGVLLRLAEDKLKTTNTATMKLHNKCELVISLIQFATRLYTQAGYHLIGAEADLQLANRSLKSVEKKLNNYFKKHTVTSQDLQHYRMILGRVRAAHSLTVELLGKLNTTLCQVASIMFVVNAYFTSQNTLEKLRGTFGGRTREQLRIREVTTKKLIQAEEFMRSLYSVPLTIYAPLKIKPKQLSLT